MSSALHSSFLFGIFIILACAQDTTRVTLFDAVNCSLEASKDLWEPSAEDATSDGGNCVETLPAPASSLIFSQLQRGCSATVYSDKWCSYNATLAVVNICTEIGDTLPIQSFSVDGCDVPFFESEVPAKPHHSLSSAAKAGIGAGIACGVLLLTAIGTLLWLKRRRSRAGLNLRDSQVQPSEPNELSGEQIFELNSPRGSEMPADREKRELPIAGLRSKSSLRIVLPELEGDHP